MPHAVQLRSAELAAASRAAVNDEHWDREQRHWPMRKVERSDKTGSYDVPGGHVAIE
jgi:hypothetical protein